MKKKIYIFMMCCLFLSACATRKNSTSREVTALSSDSVVRISKVKLDTLRIPERNVSGSIGLNTLMDIGSISYRSNGIQTTIEYRDSIIYVDCVSDSIQQLIVSTIEQYFESKNTSTTDISQTTTTIEKKTWIQLVWPLGLLLIVVLVIILIIRYGKTIFKGISRVF